MYCFSVHGCFQSFFVGVALLFIFEQTFLQQLQFPLQPQEPLFFFIFIIAKITAAIRIADIIKEMENEIDEEGNVIAKARKTYAYVENDELILE